MSKTIDQLPAAILPLTNGEEVPLFQGGISVKTALSNINFQALGGAVTSNTGVSVDGEIALFSGVTGKVIKRATGTGYAKLASGVLSAQTGVPVGDLTTFPGGTTNFLRADGTFAAPGGGGTPGGSNTQLQYNNAAAFGGITGATTDGATVTFAVSNLNLTDALITNEAAPASPAAGKVKIYTDSTDLRFHDKNASGVIGTTVVSDTGASNNFLTAISAAGAISKAQPSFSNLSGSATAAQMPAFTGDVTTSAGSTVTTNVNLPDGVTQAGSLVVTDIAAPSAPAAAHLKLYGDSTDLRFHDINAAGTIATTVVKDTGAANNFLTAISAAGVISKAQPSFANLSGVATYSQLPTIAPITQNDEAIFTVPDTGRLLQPNRLTLSGVERGTLAGVGRVLIADVLNYEPSKGVFASGSFNIMDLEYALTFQQLTLAGNARLTETGTGRQVLADLVTGTGGGGGGGNVSNSGVPTNGQLALWINATTIQGQTILPAANFPALTGDVTTTAGSLATTFTKTIPPITQNDETTFTIPDTGRLLQPNRLTLSGTERSTMAAGGRGLISDVLNYEPSKGVTSSGSFNIMDTEYEMQFRRLALSGNARLTETGTGRQVLFDQGFTGVLNAFTLDGTTMTLISPKIVTGINDVNANALLGITATAGAVNNLTLANSSASTVGGTITSVGTGSNLDIAFAPKGTGNVTITAGNNLNFPSVGAAGDGFGIGWSTQQQIRRFNSGDRMLFTNSSLDMFELIGPTGGTKVNVGNGVPFTWDSTGQPNNNTPDTGIFRNAANVMEINTGTNGQFADLKARNIFLTGTGPAPITQNDYTTGFTVPASGILQQPNRATLSGTERATLAGTGRDVISDQGPTNTPLAKVTLSPTSFIIRAGEYVMQYLRLALAGNTRATLTENARIVNFEFRPASHLVLAGAGL